MTTETGWCDMDCRLFSLAAISGLFSIVWMSSGFSQSYDLQAFDAAHIVTGSEAFERLGTSVAGGGDINGDGYDDFVVGAPLEGGGRAFVIDGYSGQILIEVLGDENSQFFGDHVAHAGDTNADGFDDFLVSDSRDRAYGSNSGQAYLFSGFDGSFIRSFSCDGQQRGRCGAAMAGDCNFDGDGVADVLIGAFDSGNGGQVFAYSGASGDLLFSLEGEQAFDQFGAAVSCSGDVDGDGKSDVAVGAWGQDFGGSQAGAAYVFSGATQELIYSWTANANDLFGSSIALIGDTDGDQRSEVLIGAPQASGQSGYADLYSGFDGSLLFRVEGFPNSQNLGHSVSKIGDVDQDGAADLLVGDPSYKSGQGRVYLISGATAELLIRYTGEPLSAPSQDFGLSLFAAGDANADGTPDLIVGTPNNSASKELAGRAYLFYNPSFVSEPPREDDEGNEEPPAEEEEEEKDDGDPQACVPTEPEPIECPMPDEADTYPEITELVKIHLQDMSWDEAWQLVRIVMSTQMEELVESNWWWRWERSALRQIEKIERQRERERRRKEREERREKENKKAKSIWDLIFWWL